MDLTRCCCNSVLWNSFVNDIDAASLGYTPVLGVPVEHENPCYASVRAPHGVIIGFHPGRSQEPPRHAGTTPYREMAEFESAPATRLARGATMHCGTVVTDFGTRVPQLTNTFGNALALNLAKR